jgi:hypothetical protein
LQGAVDQVGSVEVGFEGLGDERINQDDRQDHHTDRQHQQQFIAMALDKLPKLMICLGCWTAHILKPAGVTCHDLLPLVSENEIQMSE